MTSSDSYLLGFTPSCIPWCLSLARTSDFLWMKEYRKKWCDITSKIGLQRDGGFHIACPLLLSLVNDSCHMERSMWSETANVFNSQQGSEAVNSQVSLLIGGSSPSQTQMNTKMTMDPGNTWFSLWETWDQRIQQSHIQISDPQKLGEYKCLLFMPLSLRVICCIIISNTLPCISNILSIETLPRTFFSDP